MNQSPRILIIEDDSGIALALYKSLSPIYRVDTAKTGTSGLRKAAAKVFDVIVLDLGLPDMSGLVVCKKLRADGVDAPIIILTAENKVATKVTLFDAGASDFVCKPFSIDELQARIRAWLRKDTTEQVHPELVVGELRLIPNSRTVERRGYTIPLRGKEFALLEYLMQHAGMAVTRASLMHYAWDEGEESWTNTIDVHIKHLRDKIDRPFDRQLIKTVHGIGYKFDNSKFVTKIPRKEM